MVFTSSAARSVRSIAVSIAVFLALLLLLLTRRDAIIVLFGALVDVASFDDCRYQASH
jgi:hypothetical protein